MFQLHVVLDGQKNWLEYLPPWITAFASVVVASVIALNQTRLQTTLANRQLDLQERQLKKDLFDRRFAVFTQALDFMTYVLRNNGRIELAGPGEYGTFRESMETAEMLFGDDVNEYLAALDKTAREFCVSAQALEQAKARGDVDAINKNGQLLNDISVTFLAKRTQVFRPYLKLLARGSEPRP